MKKLIYGSLLFTPVFAFAALENVKAIIDQLKNILGILIPMAFGLAVLYFFYGIAKYVLAAGDPKAAGEGKSIMIYGVIAIAVMASIWGLVAWLQTTLGVDKINSVPVPTITGTGGALQ